MSQWLQFVKGVNSGVSCTSFLSDQEDVFMIMYKVVIRMPSGTNGGIHFLTVFLIDHRRNSAHTYFCVCIFMRRQTEGLCDKVYGDTFNWVSVQKWRGGRQRRRQGNIWQNEMKESKWGKFALFALTDRRDGGRAEKMRKNNSKCAPHFVDYLTNLRFSISVGL